MFIEDTHKLLQLVEAETGYPVQVGTTTSASADAEMISAAEGHPIHLINISSRSIQSADYIIAAQCCMLLQMWSHPQGIPEFTLNEKNISEAIREATKWKPLSSLPTSHAKKYAEMMVTGLLHQLRSQPGEFLSIEFCYKECPFLRHRQAEAMNAILRRATETLNSKIKELAPPDIYVSNQTMNAALARFWCDLVKSEIAMIPYKSLGFEDRAIALLQKFRDCDGTPGQRSVAAVDAWAEALGLRSLYEWRFRPK